MKTKKTIELAALAAFLAVSSYWLGYHHGKSSSDVSFRTASQLKQVSLEFRGQHNDIGGFNHTADVARPAVGR